jgi:pimeloyl-ACP methyl ester carboxylesterase
MIRAGFAIALLVLLVGCGPHAHRMTDRVIVFVPGVSGDGPWYGGLKRGLGDVPVETHAWGAPLPLFALNFSNRGIHDEAEAKLAQRLQRLVQAQPLARIDIVAHSAGCGVALGALGRLDRRIVDSLVLLAPSVSPTYDLAPSLAHVQGQMHVFYSDRDTLFLSWRTSNFGTYDNVKSKAAGNTGFDLSLIDPELRVGVVQHAYDPRWRDLGHDGGHDGPLAREFVARVVAPLLELTPAAPSR